MNKQEYAEYEEAVSDFFEREGIQNLSAKSDDNGTIEPYFSWSSCDCCNTGLGGNRYDADAYNPTTKEIQEYRICEDCMYYAEYGRLDDQTMWGIEHSKE